MHPSIIARPLFREEQRLYCGRNHSLFDATANLSAAAVVQYPYVGRTYMKGEARLREEAFNHRAMTSHMEAIAILVKSGRFLGYLPNHFARSFVETGEMASLLDAELAYFDTFHMALRKDERNRATLLLSQCLSTILDQGGINQPAQ